MRRIEETHRRTQEILSTKTRHQQNDFDQQARLALKGVGGLGGTSLYGGFTVVAAFSRGGQAHPFAFQLFNLYVNVRRAGRCKVGKWLLCER